MIKYQLPFWCVLMIEQILLLFCILLLFLLFFLKNCISCSAQQPRLTDLLLFTPVNEYEKWEEAQVETQVVQLMSPLTIRSPTRRPSGLNEAWRRSVAVWPCLTGISCVWHVVPKGCDLFPPFFPLFFRVFFSNSQLIRPVKGIWH